MVYEVNFMQITRRTVLHSVFASLFLSLLLLSIFFLPFSRLAAAAPLASLQLSSNRLNVANPNPGSAPAIYSSLFQAPVQQVQAQAAPAKLLFGDEFNGSSLDKSRWTTCYWWDNNGCTIASNNELEWYQPGNDLVTNGSLILQAQKQQVRASNSSTYNYTSGMVTTGPARYDQSAPSGFAFQYGYAEIKAKIPAGVGYWPAFWLLPTTRNSLPEIDVMEIIGSDPTTTHMHFHYTNSSGTEMDSGADWTGPDFSAGWHTFGVDWQPNAMIWYVDGVERRRFTDTNYIPKQPMYLLANLAVGGDWPGSPNAQTAFPGNFEIDYIRVWDHFTSTQPDPTPTLPRLQIRSRFRQLLANLAPIPLS